MIGPVMLRLNRLAIDTYRGKSSHVVAIDCRPIARIGRLASAPLDKGAGVDLFKRAGDPVRAREPLYRIHAGFATDFKFATERAHAASGYTVEPIA